MSNNKQTAIEWLIEQLTEVERKNWINNKILSIDKNTLAKQTFDGIIEQAKKMEWDQINDAYFQGFEDNVWNDYDDLYNIEYYKQTYGGNDEPA